MGKFREVVLFMLVMVMVLSVTGCAVPRAAAGVTKGVVKGTGKVVHKTGSVVTKPLR